MKKNLRYLFIVISFLMLSHAFALPQDTYSFASLTDAKRFHLLTQEVRCVVCQNQNIADSNAPLANDLREKIYLMVVNKKSDEEIKNFLVTRYGEFILLRPRFNKTTSFLWLFPLIGLVFILLFFLRLTSRQKQFQVH